MQNLKDRRLIRQIAAVFGGFILIGVFLVPEQGRRDLLRLKAELTARGERLRWQELVTNAPPDASNGWRDFYDAAIALPDLPPAKYLLHYARPGVRIPLDRVPVLPMADSRFGGRSSDGKWSSNIWDGLDTVIAPTRHVWAAAVESLTNDLIIPDLDWAKGQRLMLPHLTPIRGVAQWCALAVAYDLQSGNRETALRNLIDGFRMIGKYRAEPILITRIVRASMVDVLGQRVWPVLQHADGTDEELKALQDLVADVRVAAPLVEALEMERVFVMQAWRECIEDPSRSQAIFGYSAGSKASKPLQVAIAYGWRAGPANFDLAWYLRHRQTELDSVREALASRSLARFNARTASSVASAPGAMLMVSRTAYRDNGAMVRKALRAETRLAMLVSAIALERCRLKRGHHPESMSEMLPEFLAELPIDWMDGKPLRYERVSEEHFRLWSIGSDGVDQGGDPSPPKPVRNLRWDSGNDWVWPVAAGEAETRAYADDQLALWRKAVGTSSP